MQPSRFTIQNYGKTEVMDIDVERLLIGSGAHCDIRVGQESAAWEHIRIDEENGALIARVIPDDALAYISGAPFRESVLQDGAVIKLEHVAITYQVRNGNEVGGKVRRSKKQETSPLAYLGLIVIPFIALFILFRDRPAAVLTPPSKAPDPLGQLVKVCPIRERVGQVAFAEERENMAQTKRQRWRFYTRDGVDAVALFEVSAACYRAAGDPRADELDLYAKGMRSGVEQEFHVYRLRLERALDRGDTRSALAQIRFIEGMLVHVDPEDEYVRWLLIVKRKLEASREKKS